MELGGGLSGILPLVYFFHVVLDVIPHGHEAGVAVLRFFEVGFDLFFGAFFGIFGLDCVGVGCAVLDGELEVELGVARLPAVLAHEAVWLLVVDVAAVGAVEGVLATCADAHAVGDLARAARADNHLVKSTGA